MSEKWHFQTTVRRLDVFWKNYNISKICLVFQKKNQFCTTLMSIYADAIRILLRLRLFPAVFFIFCPMNYWQIFRAKISFKEDISPLLLLILCFRYACLILRVAIDSLDRRSVHLQALVKTQGCPRHWVRFQNLISGRPRQMIQNIKCYIFLN